MSARSRKVRLPKVWVGFDDVGVEWCTIRKPSDEDRAFNMIGPVHLYAPVTRPRVCVWTDDGSEEWSWRAACSPKVPRNSAVNYCEWCGGKIKTRNT